MKSTQTWDGWGGSGVFLGNQRDIAEYIPVGDEQTNNRGGLQAALCSLQGHQVGHRSLICPDSLLVVNGVLGWAQRWRQHKWCNTPGAWISFSGLGRRLSGSTPRHILE